MLLILLNCCASSCFEFGTDFHHHYSYLVEGILAVDDLQKKESFVHYSTMAHHGSYFTFRGRGLATQENYQIPLTFNADNDTHRLFVWDCTYSLHLPQFILCYFFNLLFERYELQLETISKEPEAMNASSIFFVFLLTIYWFFSNDFFLKIEKK